jgi:hypothetical protein
MTWRHRRVLTEKILEKTTERGRKNAGLRPGPDFGKMPPLRKLGG